MGIRDAAFVYFEEERVVRREEREEWKGCALLYGQGDKGSQETLRFGKGGGGGGQEEEEEEARGRLGSSLGNSRRASVF